MPKDLTLGKALTLAKASLAADKLKDVVELIIKSGLTRHQLAQELASSEKRSKIRRIVQSRTFWNELTKSLKEFENYWSEFCALKEWEDLSSFHLVLEVRMDKDLAETEA